MLEKVLQEDQLQQIYNWVDEIPLSRPKRNMSRDFSDAVLMAEIIAHFNPRIVQLHNYVSTGSVAQKIANWKLLNEKTLKKIKICLSKEQIQSLANCEPNEVEKLIYLVRKHISEENTSPTIVSKTTKTSKIPAALSLKPPPKPTYSTMKQIKRVPAISELLTSQDKCIDLLREQVQLLGLKAGKLEEIIKGKDRQIEQMVKKIKLKGIS